MIAKLLYLGGWVEPDLTGKPRKSGKKSKQTRKALTPYPLPLEAVIIVYIAMIFICKSHDNYQPWKLYGFIPISPLCCSTYTRKDSALYSSRACDTLTIIFFPI